MWADTAVSNAFGWAVRESKLEWWKSWFPLFSSPEPAVQNASDGQSAIWMDDVQESWAMDSGQTLSPKEQWDDKVCNITKSNIFF